MDPENKPKSQEQVEREKNKATNGKSWFHGETFKEREGRRFCTVM
jgi:hypothetical protein